MALNNVQIDEIEALQQTEEPASNAPLIKNPYQLRIQLPLLIIPFLYFSISYYDKHKTVEFNPQQYLEPCNFTDVWSLNDTYKFKEKLKTIHRYINSALKDYYYGIPDADKILLDNKIEKYRNDLGKLHKEFVGQQELRFNCFKENLHTLACGSFDPVINIHFGAVLLLLSISIRYMIKSRIKLDIPTKEIFKLLCIAGMFVGYTLLIVIFFVEYYVLPCKVGKAYLIKFPL